MRACAEGKGTREEIAQLFQVSTAWIRRLHQQLRESGSYAAKPHGGGRRQAFSSEEMEQLKVHVEQQPDVTLEELRERMGKPVSLVAVWRALQRLGLRRKKNPSGQVNRVVPKSSSSARSGRHVSAK
jgi:transposase